MCSRLGCPLIFEKHPGLPLLAEGQSPRVQPSDPGFAIRPRSNNLLIERNTAMPQAAAPRCCCLNAAIRLQLDSR